MTSTQIQFHADPDEAVAIAVRLAREFGLTPVLEWYFPSYRAAIAGDKGSIASDDNMARIDSVASCRHEPNLMARSSQEFADLNPDCLYLSVGGREVDGVRESALGGVTDDPETLRIWRRLIRNARSSMHRGATVRNPVLGGEHHLPSHLHTAGAHRLAADGVRMLAPGGWNEYEFDDLADAEAPTRD